MNDDFIDNLKRDKARGNTAPHQVLLLITLHNLYNEKRHFDFEIKEIILSFDETWEKYEHLFQTKSKIVGMPLKAFYNQGFNGLEFYTEIKDFRNKNSLEQNIKAIVLNNSLKIFLQATNLQALEERITK